MDKVSFFIDKCRCCLQEIDEATSCEIDEIIASQIAFVTSIELTISPKLSTNLCNECINKISDSYQFKLDFIERQEKLNQLLENDCEGYEQTYEILEVYENEELVEEYKSTEIEEIKAIAQFKKRKKDENVEECLSCNKIFPTKKKLKNHIARIHKPDFKDGKDKRTICAYCGKILKGNNHLNFHIKVKHLQLTKYKCDLCDFSSYGKYEIRSHLIIHHLPLEARKQYPCDECNSILTTRMSLKIHKTHKHSDSRPHYCFCGKSFALKETLKSHIRNVHNGERKYKCPIKDCNKGFNSISRLNDHVNNMHGQKQEIPCDKCGKIFNSLRNLQTHAIYHNDPKLKCNYCEKLFYIKKNLREHQESVHLGVTYSCNSCQKKFQSQSGLRRHNKNFCKG